MTSAEVVPEISRRGQEASAGARPHGIGVPVVGVVASAAVTTLFAPDLVSGSQHEHLPLPALLVWLWAAIAIAHIALWHRADLDDRSRRSVVAEIVSLWTVSAALAIFGPQLVTGTDPTHIPLTAICAPIFAAFATSYVLLRAAVASAGERRS